MTLFPAGNGLVQSRIICYLSIRNENGGTNCVVERKEYSAGAVKMSFWFMEFRKVVELLAAGHSFDEVKRMMCLPIKKITGTAS